MTVELPQLPKPLPRYRRIASDTMTARPSFPAVTTFGWKPRSIHLGRGFFQAWRLFQPLYRLV
jgi:hypothetical protein